jgi:hypothetical protein
LARSGLSSSGIEKKFTGALDVQVEVKSIDAAQAELAFGDARRHSISAKAFSALKSSGRKERNEESIGCLGTAKTDFTPKIRAPKV